MLEVAQARTVAVGLGLELGLEPGVDLQGLGDDGRWAARSSSAW
jgi:hypothetical protein